MSATDCEAEQQAYQRQCELDRLQYEANIKALAKATAEAEAKARAEAERQLSIEIDTFMRKIAPLQKQAKGKLPLKLTDPPKAGLQRIQDVLKPLGLFIEIIPQYVEGPRSLGLEFQTIQTYWLTKLKPSAKA